MFLNIILLGRRLRPSKTNGGYFMVFEKIKSILADQLDADEDAITMETDISADLGADSLDVVELIMSIEDDFEIQVPDDKLEDVKTVGDIVNYIQSQQ